MNNAHPAANPSTLAQERRRGRVSTRRHRTWGLLAAGLMACAASHAIDFGPFTLNGFAKGELTRGSNDCGDCQRFPKENRQRAWADELNVGAPFDSRTHFVSLIQPYVGVHFDLPRGFKLSGLISQRYRDGDVDIPGYMYEKNLAISHEDYGSIRVGKMTSRAWSVADYPFGTDIGVSDPWSSSGAGYALLGHALRYTSRIFDVAEGDLVLEATYDTGASGWKQNNPHLWELWAQYNRGPLHMDLMFQDSRNGEPVSWGHAPFNALTPFSLDDSKLGSSGQGMIMLMGRYDVTSQLQLSAGLRRNRWSGAYAVITEPVSSSNPTGAQWNSMFNVDWGGTLNGVANPGYAVTTVDGVLGARYKFGKWVASTGMVYLSKGSTKNPSERGQSNWALFNVADLGYEFQPGLKVYAQAGMVHYGRLGLAPMSMPSTAAFTRIDPRVSKEGNWFTLGVVYAF